MRSHSSSVLHLGFFCILKIFIPFPKCRQYSCGQYSCGQYSWRQYLKHLRFALFFNIFKISSLLWYFMILKGIISYFPQNFVTPRVFLVPPEFFLVFHFLRFIFVPPDFFDFLFLTSPPPLFFEDFLFYCGRGIPSVAHTGHSRTSTV